MSRRFAGGLVLFLVTAFVLTAVPASADTVSGGSTSTYFRLRPDMRDCPSIDCGGLWVSQVNRRSNFCPSTQTLALECYVPAVTYISQLGADTATFEAFRNEVAGGRGLIRGRLALTRFGTRVYNRLVAIEGWRSSSAGPSRPSGAFRQLEFNGIVCVAAPCFDIHAALLNSSLHTDISGVDLSPSGAPADEQDKALQAIRTPPPGVIASGALASDPNGGVTLSAEQFYRNIAA